MLTGVNNVEEAKQLITEIVVPLKSDQFELHKWRSNCAKKLFDMSDSAGLILT